MRENVDVSEIDITKDFSPVKPWQTGNSAELRKLQMKAECCALIDELRKINARIVAIRNLTLCNGPAIDAEKNVTRAISRLQAQMEAKV